MGRVARPTDCGELMIKVMVFLTRLPHLSRDAFKDYYETQHVPLIEKLLPMIEGYERNYPDAAKVRPADGQTVDEAIGFDALTVMKFEDRESFNAWKAALKDPETLGVIHADEARFLDNAKTRLFVMDERLSA
jgi:uncharacterized protein (TIGR02118 family)